MNMYELCILYTGHLLWKRFAVWMEANYTRVRSCLWWKLNSAIMLGNFVALHIWKYKTNTWKLDRCRENEKYQDWEVPLKNKTWQTDEIAQQCEMQVWIQHSQHLATRHETLKQKSASIIGTQYHLSRLERVWTICFGWILTCPHVASFLWYSYRCVH